MKKILQSMDTLTRFIGHVVAWLTLAMVLLTAFLVLMRYVFSKNWISLQELVMYFHAAIFMLGIAYTLQTNRHVRVDIFYQRFSEKSKAWVNLIGSLLFLLPFSLFVLYFSWAFVRNAYGLKGANGWIWHLEGSAQAGGLPAVFILKTLIMAFALLLFVQGVAEVLRNILFLHTDNPLEK